MFFQSSLKTVAVFSPKLVLIWAPSIINRGPWRRHRRITPESEARADWLPTSPPSWPTPSGTVTSGCCGDGPSSRCQCARWVRVEQGIRAPLTQRYKHLLLIYLVIQSHITAHLNLHFINLAISALVYIIRSIWVNLYFCQMLLDMIRRVFFLFSIVTASVLSGICVFSFLFPCS